MMGFIIFVLYFIAALFILEFFFQMGLATVGVVVIVFITFILLLAKR